MTSNTFITFNVYSCCNWCLSQLNAERMILINGDLKKIFAGGSSYAYGTTTCSGKDCTVSVTYHGTTKYGSGYGYANAKNSASGSGTRASSYHTAGGYSTNISY